jgi:hypothetical protein
MDVSQAATSSAMAMIVQQLESISEMQVEVMKDMAASQQQMAEMLQSLGIGQNVNISV